MPVMRKPLLMAAACVALWVISPLLRAQQEPPAPVFVVSEFVVDGNNPLSVQETNAALQPFLGEHEGLDGLLAATDALEKALRDKGFSFHRVVLPPQTLKDGLVRFEIVQFVVGAIEVDGNEHFDTDNIIASLGYLEPGLTPNTRLLSRSINLANMHPSKQVRLLFRDSEQPGAINARLEVKDQPPGYGFLVFNNTGNEQTGDYRVTAGYQYSNLFNRDHGITASYTTSPTEPDKVSQFGFSYRMPFYRQGGALNFLLSTSDVSDGEIPQASGGDPILVSGKGNVFGVRYEQHFLRRGNYSHQLTGGLDFKQFFDNTFDSGTGAQPTTPDIASMPLVVDYTGNWVKPELVLNFGLGASYNIKGGGDNDDADYEDPAFFGAEADWSSYRYSVGANWFFSPDWLFRARLRGQTASGTLIPGEKFGVGGASTLRGIDERVLTGDSGYVANLEVWFPPLMDGQLRFLAFYDLGHVANDNDDQPAVSSSDGSVENDADMAAIGAGLRWTWRENLSVQLDLAAVTEDAGEIESGDSKAHLSAFYRF